MLATFPFHINIAPEHVPAGRQISAADFDRLQEIPGALRPRPKLEGIEQEWAELAWLEWVEETERKVQ